MAISSDYSTPVIVNGFSCKNCTDVDYAKKHIDPEHPKSGPYGINAKDDPTVKNALAAVSFGGNLSSLNAAQGTADLSGNTDGETAPNLTVGAFLDIKA
jgi:hypothetical protein